MKRLLLVSFTLLFFQSCITDSKNEGTKVKYEEIFPIHSVTNRWHFSDHSGNELTLRVSDSVKDGGDYYYKITIDETLATEQASYWILQGADEFLLGNSLRGAFHALLPKRLKSSGGNFTNAGHDVTYEIYQNYCITHSNMKDVVELNYSGTVLGGFTRIAFANSVGPIRFVDDSGRWPVEYDLDSAYIDGVTLNLTK